MQMSTAGGPVPTNEDAWEFRFGPGMIGSGSIGSIPAANGQIQAHVIEVAEQPASSRVVAESPPRVQQMQGMVRPTQGEYMNEEAWDFRHGRGSQTQSISSQPAINGQAASI